MRGLFFCLALLALPLAAQAGHGTIEETDDGIVVEFSGDATDKTDKTDKAAPPARTPLPPAAASQTAGQQAPNPAVPASSPAPPAQGSASANSTPAATSTEVQTDDSASRRVRFGEVLRRSKQQRQRPPRNIEE